MRTTRRRFAAHANAIAARPKNRPVSFERLAGLNHALPLQDVEVAVHHHRRMLEHFALSPCRADNRSRLEIEEIVDEYVGMLRFHPIRRQHCVGKVLLIERHDHTGVAADRGGQDMPIISIRQPQTLDQRFVPGHQRIRYRPIHQTRGTVELRGTEVHALAQQIPFPFVVDIGTPASPETSAQCEPHQEIA